MQELDKRVKRGSQKKTARHIVIGESYKNSSSFEELRSKFGLKEITLMNHLTTYVSEGNKIDSSLLYEQIGANDEEQIEVFKAFEELGVGYLKPIFDKLEENVTYDDLRVLKVCYLNQWKFIKDNKYFYYLDDNYLMCCNQISGCKWISISYFI